MENGIQMTLEQYTEQTYQEPISGLSGRHASRLVSLEKEQVLTEQVDLLEKSLEYLMNSKKKIDPNGLSMKTLRECLVQIQDGIMPLSCLKWSRGGYDIEWQNINSAWFVPQNRERIYTIGHIRAKGRKQILPIEGTNGENSVCQIGKQKSHRENPNQYRVYDKNGCGAALNCMEGGGREPHIAEIVPNQTFIDLHTGGDLL